MKANRIMQQCSERLTHLFAKRLFTLFSQFTGSVSFSGLCGELQHQKKKWMIRLKCMSANKNN